MKKYLITEKGQFYKANLHCHTNVSDGKKSPEEVKEHYKKMGYSVVAYTDHDILIPHDDLTDDTFLAMHGFEVEIHEEIEGAKIERRHVCHVCYVSLDKDNITMPFWHREKYVWSRNAKTFIPQVKFHEDEPDYERHFDGETISDMMQKGRDRGFFVTYNHPTWSMQDYSHYMGYNGMHAVEIFNGSCIAGGYDDINGRVYDDLIRGGKQIFCIGADDNHNLQSDDTRHSDSGIAFTMIKAEELSYPAIAKALKNGDFYASVGPEISELWYENGRVYVKCSDADRVFCTYGIRKGGTVYSENGIPVREADFEVPKDCKYFRLTVVDAKGQRACTNAYFVDDSWE